VKYAALIGDIMASRHIENRDQAQTHFETTLEKANSMFSKSLVARFSIYAGDECEALFSDPVEARKASCFIRREMVPYRLLFGLGIGEISTAIDRFHVGRVDGPAFHLAREAIGRAKKEKAGFVICANHPYVELANTVLLLIAVIEGKTKKRSAEAAFLMEQYNNQYVVAEKMSVTQATVNRFLMRAKYKQIQGAISTLDDFLPRLMWDI
jgi:hypothetical protein